ncbi:MAG: M23 family metallopeptidase [Candidatus Riflebacteria bacterium]|nr:M23 family metallopeptidase [Candidatus Riflebacteria bacterium]
MRDPILMTALILVLSAPVFAQVGPTPGAIELIGETSETASPTGTPATTSEAGQPASVGEPAEAVDTSAAPEPRTLTTTSDGRSFTDSRPPVVLAHAIVKNVWPAPGRITSGYGNRNHPVLRKKRFHDGIDIGARSGARCVAVGPGVVTFVGWEPGYGRVVTVRITAGGQTYDVTYAHLSKALVAKGQKVNSGQAVGLVGSSGGYSTGPHLHLRVHKNGHPVNPMTVLRSSARA